MKSFTSFVEFALIVHPYEAKSTVGTAHILRQSIKNLGWIRSNGLDLDTDQKFLKLTTNPLVVPLLLFPGNQAFSLNQGSNESWSKLIAPNLRPLFIVIDGTWTQARAILRRSRVLQSLAQVSFQSSRLSEYGFKKQPHPHCLSSVEGVHRVLEVLALRGWSDLPKLREHDRMIDIFRQMVKYQLAQEKIPAARLSKVMSL